MHNNGISIQPFGKFMDDLFNRSISDIVGTDFTNESPAVNIIENDDSFVMEVAAPGLDKEDFNVSIEKDFLTISAERKNENVEEDADKGYKRREYNFQKFTRKFRLPETVDRESLEARYNQGILEITVQKTAEAKEQGPRTIEIS